MALPGQGHFPGFGWPWDMRELIGESFFEVAALEIVTVTLLLE